MEKKKLMDIYTKGKQLVVGNFGVTCLCTKIATGQHYACKCIQKHTLISQTQFEPIEHEIDILSLINHQEHPNIIFMKDNFEDDAYVYIVTELCEGGTIHDSLLAYGTFDEQRAARMIKEITSAIETCHSSGIVHRDLKLENLLFQTKDKDSSLKVIDFGLAQFFKHGEVLTDVVGSPLYVAPEVVKRHYGPKADIWSLGVILYTLLSGLYPFDADTFLEAYKEVMKGDELFDEDPWPTISEGAKDLIGKMLTCDVNMRYSASEVLKHPWILENAK